VLDPDALSDWSRLVPHAVNDFEPVVASRHPQIQTLVDRLRAAGCDIAMMSGSGSSVFGVFPASGPVEMPHFAAEGADTAPRAALTRTAARVEPVVAIE
jgi:4-diphosphocytidyl-2C-methyl-D-erythritol kinase